MAAKTIDELAGNCDVLLKHTEGFQLPITRNVAQISEKSLQLAQGPSVVDPNRAQSLLRAGGVEMSQIHKDISASMMETDTTSYAGLQLNANDVEGYLSLERDRTIISAISETRNETLQKTREQFHKTLQSEWENTKRELLSHMGIQFSSSVISSGIPTPYNNAASTSSIPQAAYPAPSLRTALTEHTASYARIVSNMIGKTQVTSAHPTPISTPNIPTPHISGNKLSFMQEFESHTRTQGKGSTPELNDAWKLLSAMVAKVTNTAPSAPNSHTHAKATHDVIRQARKNGDITNSALLIEGALDFLHSQYANLIEAEIVRQPMVAKHGGVPGEDPTIRAYLNVIFAREDKQTKVDGVNPWAYVFYMLRCGWIGHAHKFVDRNQDKFGNFSRYFNEYCMGNRRLSVATWENCRRDYYNSLDRADQKDPYKQLVWNLVARGDGNDYRSFRTIITSTQDFIWYRLMMVSTEQVADKAKAGELQLKQVQQHLFDLGPSHFSPGGRSPLIYLFVLLSMQLFEQGIAFLFSATQYQVEAIHMAIALDYYGLLHVPAALPEIPVELLSTQQGVITFNIARLIRDYASHLVATNPYESLTYCALLERNAKELVSCVSDLVFASGELELFLGATNSDDKIKQSGLISMVFPQYQKEIRQTVAARCQAQGKIEEAIQLYELSTEYDAALQLAIRQLSKLLAARSPDRQRTVRLARDMYKRLQATQFAGLQTPLLVAFDQLLSLDVFFDLVNSMKFAEALDHMARLNLIPFYPMQIQTCTATFHRLHETVKRLFPEILSTTMQILTHQHTLLSHTPQTPFDNGRAERDLNIRTAAKAIVTFSGTIQYQIPKDLTAQLLSSELIIRS